MPYRSYIVLDISKLRSYNIALANCIFISAGKQGKVQNQHQSIANGRPEPHLRHAHLADEVKLAAARLVAPAPHRVVPDVDTVEVVQTVWLLDAGPVLEKVRRSTSHRSGQTAILLTALQ